MGKAGECARHRGLRFCGYGWLPLLSGRLDQRWFEYLLVQYRRD